MSGGVVTFGEAAIITGRRRRYATRQPEPISVAVARAMHEALDAMVPIREAARGLRTQLELEDGYSPQAAEYLSGRFMTTCMRGLKLSVSIDVENGPIDDPRTESGRP
jgi:hypothetical protein